jgi:uncharacterized Zn finger protein (UPF0148 family)
MMSDESSARIKSAASLLVKGGTLTDEPCSKCGGVQVKFSDKTTCINCGNETKVGEKPKAPAPKQATGNLASAAALIEEKVALLASEIRSESDISVQKQKAELLESYLRILEKARELAG